MTTDAQNELEKIRQGLTTWLQLQMPEVQNLKVSGLRQPEVGASNETLFFDAGWDKDEKHESKGMVARLKVMSGPQVFPEYDLEFQYKVVDVLGKTDVLVPELFGYEASGKVLGAPFYVMGRLEGNLPVENPPYHTEGWLVDLTPDERTDIWKSGIESMSKIHKLDWQKNGFAFLNRPKRGQLPLEQELHYYREFYGWVRKGRRHPLCEEALAWLETNKPKNSDPVGVCWGDAKLGNMIFQGTKCVGLFDWELAQLGNPANDVAWYLMLDRCLSEGCDTPRLSGFLSRDETVAYWEKVSGMKSENFEYYELFAYYRFSVIMYRIISMYKETGKWPEDSDYDVWNLASVMLDKEMALRR